MNLIEEKKNYYKVKVNEKPIIFFKTKFLKTNKKECKNCRFFSICDKEKIDYFDNKNKFNYEKEHMDIIKEMLVLENNKKDYECIGNLKTLEEGIKNLSEMNELYKKLMDDYKKMELEFIRRYNE